VDNDGVSRRVPMLAEYKGKYYESFSLAIVRMYLAIQEAVRSKSTTLKLPDVTLNAIPDRFVTPATPAWNGSKSDRSGSRWTRNLLPRPYRGARGSFPYISFADIWADQAPADALRGKIALIGATAPGLFDLRSAPVANVYPGVEIHANLIAGMLDGKVKQKPPICLVRRSCS